MGPKEKAQISLDWSGICDDLDELRILALLDCHAENGRQPLWDCQNRRIRYVRVAAVLDLMAVIRPQGVDLVVWVDLDQESKNN